MLKFIYNIKQISVTLSKLMLRIRFRKVLQELRSHPCKITNYKNFGNFIETCLQSEMGIEYISSIRSERNNNIIHLIFEHIYNINKQNKIYNDRNQPGQNINLNSKWIKLTKKMLKIVSLRKLLFERNNLDLAPVHYLMHEKPDSLTIIYHMIENNIIKITDVLTYKDEEENNIIDHIIYNLMIDEEAASLKEVIIKDFCKILNHPGYKKIVTNILRSTNYYNKMSMDNILIDCNIELFNLMLNLMFTCFEHFEVKYHFSQSLKKSNIPEDKKQTFQKEFDAKYDIINQRFKRKTALSNIMLKKALDPYLVDNITSFLGIEPDYDKVDEIEKKPNFVSHLISNDFTNLFKNLDSKSVRR